MLAWQQISAFLAHQQGERSFICIENSRNTTDLSHTCRKNMTNLIEKGTRGIYELGSLMNKALSGTKQCCERLLLFGLRRGKPHFWLSRCNDDRLRISGIILLPLDERAHILRRDQKNFMTELHKFTRPIMGATTGLHRNHCFWMLGHETQEARRPRDR